MIGLALAGAAGGGIYMTGAAGSQGEYYERPPTEIENSLKSMRMPDDFGGPTSATSALQRRASEPGTVKWVLIENRYPVAEILATVAPEGSGARVSVDFELTDQMPQEMRDSEFVNDVAEIVVLEQIDATIEQREFDARTIMAKLAGKVWSDPATLERYKKSIEDLENAEMSPAAKERLLREHDFYADEATGSSSEWGEHTSFE
ncbi:hypothetical protein [Qipengyuania sp. JC766]|uniref:hypothetical protein n=1 Tax=Qipengyuania sp. JC766 TaxID=3232139 RepID=UPI0034594845